MRHPRPLATLAALAGALLSAACAGDGTGPNESPSLAGITVQAAVVPALVAGISVEVTASDIPTPIIANIPVVNGNASGVVNVPVGSNRHFTLRAFDQQGVQTHVGEETVAVRGGTNPTLTVGLRPLAGQQPITVTFGFFTIAITNATPLLRPGQSQQLTAVVTGLDGTAVVNPVLQWGSLNPSVATVDGAGRLTALVTGETTIGVSYEGISATTAVVVASGYTITDLGLPDGPFEQSTAYAINDAGEVALGAFGKSGDEHAFRWTQASGMARLDVLDPTAIGVISHAVAINSSGQIVGEIRTQQAGPPQQAVRWTGGAQQLLFDPNTNLMTFATGITDAGAIIGYAFLGGYQAFHLDPSGEYHALGEFEPTDINEHGVIVGIARSGMSQAVVRWASSEPAVALSSVRSYANAVNDGGVVVGASAIPGHFYSHAVTWRLVESNGTAVTMRDLGTLPGGGVSEALAINRAGQVVGYSAATPTSTGHAFVWSEATGMIDLGTLPGSNGSSVARGINTRGQIVGWSADAAGRRHAVLWTPPPATPPTTSLR